jgi:hypothetical protein
MWTRDQFIGPTVEETDACLALGALGAQACRDWVDSIGVGRQIRMLFRDGWESIVADAIIDGEGLSVAAPWWVPFFVREGLSRGVDSWDEGISNPGVRCLLRLAEHRRCHIVSTQLAWLAERAKAGESTDEAVSEVRGWLELLSPSQ